MHTLFQQKWLTKLLGFDYTLFYKKGTNNRVADALSRASCSSLTTIQPQWLEDVQGSYTDDHLGKELISKLMLSPVHPEGYTYSQGILRQHGRIYIGSSGNARQNILAAAHSSAIGGHSGVQACYQRDDLRRVDTIFLVLKVFFESRCQI